ncbi:MAG: hypothetical protein GY805_12385 [Chloroflexi bacterium]|nr:hypothetical protein [Chloroflexota bacterium]
MPYAAIPMLIPLLNIVSCPVFDVATRPPTLSLPVCIPAFCALSYRPPNLTITAVPLPAKISAASLII